MTAIVPATAMAPALIAASGDRAAYRFLEFFTAQLRTSRTRKAYAKAVGHFLRWANVSVRSVPSPRSTWRPGSNS